MAEASRAEEGARLPGTGAWIAGADRWSDATWRDLKQQLGTGEPEAEPATTAAPKPAPAPSAGFVRRRPVRGRRVITPSYLR